MRPEVVTDGDVSVAAVIDAWAERGDRAVIFDFNGTLSNDEPLLLRLFSQLFEARLGFSLTAGDYFERFAGRSDREIVEMAVARFAPGDASLVEQMLIERRRRYRELVEERSPVEPATLDLVHLLHDHRVPMAVVTGAQRGDVEFVLRGCGLAELLAVIVTEEDIRDGKPHPEGFERGAFLLGVDPSSVLVFEDSLYGVRAAHAAKMRCIGVEGTKSRAELQQEADAVVGELGPALFEQVLRR